MVGVGRVWFFRVASHSTRALLRCERAGQLSLTIKARTEELALDAPAAPGILPPQTSAGIGHRAGGGLPPVSCAQGDNKGHRLDGKFLGLDGAGQGQHGPGAGPPAPAEAPPSTVMLCP